MLPWFIRSRSLYARELKRLRRAYPGMEVSPAALDRSRLVLHGELKIGLGSAWKSVPTRLEYPDAFPYAFPEVTPLRARPEDDSHPLEAAPMFFCQRHQMSNGSICLFERQAARAEYVSGVDALQRAEQWLRCAVRGRFPAQFDSLEAELESHYIRAGDVLLGPAAYEDLGESGELILDDMAKIRPEAYPLAAVTHITNHGMWVNDGEVLGRIGIRRTEEYWRTTPPDAPGRLRMRWYTIDAEPPPLRSASDIAGLLFGSERNPLARLERETTTERSRAIAVHIPLRFPTRRRDGWSWLFFRIPIRDASLPAQAVPGMNARGQILDLGSTFSDAPVHVLMCQDLRPSRLQLRNRNRVPAEATRLRISLAGTGALGSTCAELFAKAGVAALHLCDLRALNSHHAVRHLAGVALAGTPKAWATAMIASRHNPHCEIESGRIGSVLELAPDDPFWAADAVVSTIADDAVELALNRNAVERANVIYYLRALRSGSTVRLVRVRPKVDACLECIGIYAMEDDPRVIDVAPADDEVITRECASPVLAASAADLAIAAGLGVRQVLADFGAGDGSNQWVWTAEGIPNSHGLEKPFSSRATFLPPHERCPICCPRAPTRLVLGDDLRAAIVEMARAASPVETGGILVGTRKGDDVLVLSASDAGPNATSTQEMFLRDGAYCQAFLERKARELGPGIDYVGEWHSHPSSDATPSLRDERSFREIAADPHVLAQAPALVVIGLAGAGGNVETSATSFLPSGAASPMVVVASATVVASERGAG
jgi:integrative and conjugative element protein (TIGR02256 family)